MCNGIEMLRRRRRNAGRAASSSWQWQFPQEFSSLARWFIELHWIGIVVCWIYNDAIYAMYIRLDSLMHQHLWDVFSSDERILAHSTVVAMIMILFVSVFAKECNFNTFHILRVSVHLLRSFPNASLIKYSYAFSWHIYIYWIWHIFFMSLVHVWSQVSWGINNHRSRIAHYRWSGIWISTQWKPINYFIQW